MKSIFIILVIYICIYFYGQSMPDPFVANKNENAQDSLIFKNNSLPIFRNDGQKLAHFKSQEFSAGNDFYHAKNINIHIYSINDKKEKKSIEENINQKIKLPPEDVYLDADIAEFASSLEPISFKGNVKMTFGKSTYLETQECQWSKKTETISFPNTFSMQTGNNLIKGEIGTFNTLDKDIRLEKNIVSFFEFADYKIEEQSSTEKDKLSKLTSIGPLIYHNSYRSIKLPNFTTIKNKDIILSADKIEFYLNDENKIHLLKAEGNVKIKFTKKDIFAWGPKAVINIADRLYHFTESQNLPPFIEMNGFRQSAAYIYYSEATEILRAGPDVKSVKIIPDSKE